MEAGGEGAAQLRQRLVHAQGEDHFQHVVARDVVGAAEGRDHHHPQEHMLEQREAQRLEHTDHATGVFAVPGGGASNGASAASSSGPIATVTPQDNGSTSATSSLVNIAATKPCLNRRNNPKELTLKTLTISEYEQIVSDLRVHIINENAARTAVYTVLSAVNHPGVETVKTAEEVTDWLRKGFTLVSWLDYNKSRALNVKLALPALWETYTSAKTATLLLRTAEQEFTKLSVAGKQDAEA